MHSGIKQEIVTTPKLKLFSHEPNRKPSSTRKKEGGQKEGKMRVLDCKGCHSNELQTHWLRQQNLLCRSSGGHRSLLQWGCQQSLFLLGARRKNLFQPPTPPHPVSHGSWQSLVFLSCRRLTLISTFPLSSQGPPCVCISPAKSLFHKAYQSHWNRASTKYIYNSPISKGYILSYCRLDFIISGGTQFMIPVHDLSGYYRASSFCTCAALFKFSS